MLESTDSVIILKNRYLNPFEKILYERDHKEDLKRMVKKEGGKFFYNLYVTTSGNVFLKFIVNEKSQQEFFGEIKTDLYIDNRDNEMAGRGEVHWGAIAITNFSESLMHPGKLSLPDRLQILSLILMQSTKDMLPAII